MMIHGHNTLYIWSTLQFPINYLFRFPHHHYLLHLLGKWVIRYQVLYQTGVFLSRSSVNLVELKRTWIMAILQVGFLFVSGQYCERFSLLPFPYKICSCWKLLSSHFSIYGEKIKQKALGFCPLCLYRSRVL